MSDEAKKTDIGTEPIEEPEKEFLRFSLAFRLQHIAMFVSVIALIVTGIPLKYADTSWAIRFFQAIGGVEVSGLIHRAGALILIGVGVAHLFYTVIAREGRYNFLELLPKVRDVTDVIHNVLYFFGFSKDRPKFGRFSYFEKFDYWAVYWGMVIMIGSGLILWFSTRAMALMPKVWIDVAHEAHSDEGLLATLAIVVWHFYNVHFNPDHWPGNFTWWNGRMSERKMKHHHPLEYEKLIAPPEEEIEPEEDETPVQMPIAELAEPEPVEALAEPEESEPKTESEEEEAE